MGLDKWIPEVKRLHCVHCLTAFQIGRYEVYVNSLRLWFRSDHPWRGTPWPWPESEHYNWGLAFPIGTIYRQTRG